MRGEKENILRNGFLRDVLVFISPISSSLITTCDGRVVFGLVMACLITFFWTTSGLYWPRSVR